MEHPRWGVCSNYLTDLVNPSGEALKVWQEERLFHGDWMPQSCGKCRCQ
ncbi:hypothetical protein SLEP1_g53754 [Rubroshorea leprosula]|uniref:Uncharacterized protein n=1 Tax=Rubroshorea leprosula TaxID=152421 RepID=A0AAV5MD51_9ROSI|nr:hypothetical protein SLEP1_g53754 [Rubroshorea leprosula]